MSTEGQYLLWLCGPIIEWQSLWHLTHMNDEGSCIGDALFLLFCLLVFFRLGPLFFSRVANPSYTPVAKHHGRLPPPPTSPRPYPFTLGPAYTHHCNGEKAVLSCHHFSVQYVLGDAAVFHTAGVAKPAQPALRTKRVHAWYIGLP